MGTLITVLIIFALAIGIIVCMASCLSDDQIDNLAYGEKNRHIVCQQCGHKGSVHTKPFEKKAGVSGGKATAALLTGGVSLLAVGLSRKEKSTEAHCCKCGSTWNF